MAVGRLAATGTVTIMVGIGLGLVGLLCGGVLVWAATDGDEGLGRAGDQPGRRRRGLLAAGAVLAVVGLLLLVGGLVELAR
jgi:hypothetical protein